MGLHKRTYLKKARSQLHLDGELDHVLTSYLKGQIMYEKDKTIFVPPLVLCSLYEAAACKLNGVIA
jgi:hypothetical protein